ncbi:MAG: hypothetical protein ACTSRU_20280 [Candidatus Hodarchaeales archaeon]
MSSNFDNSLISFFNGMFVLILLMILYRAVPAFLTWLDDKL